VYVHKECKAIYLAAPRTASIATKDALIKIGFRKKCFCPSGDGTHAWNCGKHHATLRLLSERDKWTVFTTVRNHWDTAISWYFYNNSGERSLFRIDDIKHAFDNGWTKPHALWYLHTGNADRILKYESLDADLNAVLKAVGLPAVEVPHVHLSANRDGRPWRSFYDQEGYEYVKKRFWDEIVQYGYDKETL
jgi:hypothetical protein